MNYYTDDGDSIYVFSNGQQVSEDARVFSNGDYRVKTNTGGFVYDSNRQKLFTFDSDGYVPYGSIGEDYIIANKYDKDAGENIYAIYDRNGKIIIEGAEDDDFEQYGDYIVSPDGKLYNNKGKCIFEEEFEEFVCNENFDDLMILYTGNEYVIVDRNMDERGRVDSSDDIEFYDSYFTKEIDDTKYCYSLADNDFTVEGSVVYDALWLGSVEGNNYTNILVNLMTGEELLDGYSYYTVENFDDQIYIYAKSSDGGIDVYLVK